ncbi:LemA family protein [Treponema sp.]
MTIFLIILGLVAAGVLFFVSIYNGFVALRNKCEEAFATMDAYLKKRWDLIPNLVETVKGYASHEKGTLEAVVQARNMAMSSKDMGELQANESALASSLKSVFALSEAYPELKANESFVNLQNQLQGIETDILQSRKYYNAIVQTFNTKRELFPQSIIAGMMGLEKKEYFELADAERAPVKVSF